MPRSVSPGATVLVAAADPLLRDAVRRHLARAGHRVLVAADGAAVLDLTAAPDAADPVDLAVLAAGLPDVDGVTACRILRARDRAQVPLVLLTGGADEDRIAALDAGADDALSVPFDPRELTLRVAAVLRRARWWPRPDDEVLADGPLRVHPRSQRVDIDGAEVDLTPREFALLAFLLRHRGRVFGRDELLERVWGWQVGDLSTVTVHVKRLRAKLGPHHRIDTLWGRGYAWDRAAEAAAG
ncbi:response regulator transcription factor [Nocardia thailandica]